jgi:asparagine synthase (glutamine-hydrolysing)
MCGIAGIVNLDRRKIDSELLVRMVEIISHRGPDNRGLYINDNVGLGHRRLKIIDLSSRAAQPMSNEDNSLVITYNGEVYNYIEIRKELELRGHKFNSASDVEVVIHSYEEWGPECLQHFIGMWAFVIWDKRQKKLFASRDRLGIKPFYYFYDGATFVFASEIKSILEIPLVERRLNAQAIFEYLYLGYSLGDKTAVVNINRLNSGHFLILDERGLNTYRYWRPLANIDYSINEKDASEKILDLLEDSVRLTLRSDVEVGVYLSGGVDSSSVVATASRLSGRRLHTFSGAFGEGIEFDERPFVNQMVKMYPLHSHQIIIRPDNFLESMKKIVWHLDEPVAGPGAYPQFLVSKLIGDFKIKVVLGGQGGDELFGGYPHYYSGLLGSTFADLRFNNFRSSKYINLSFLIKLFLSSIRREISQRLKLRKKRLLSSLDRSFLKQISIRDLEDKIGFYKGTLEDMILWDINNYLPALLQVEDRMGMAHSIETRLPLLDHRLVEYALKIPAWLKINRLNFKYILRKAVRDLLPKGIYQRRDKRGFSTPFRIWTLNSNFYDPIYEEIKPLLKGIFCRRGSPFWEKVSIGLWMKIFKIRI